MEQTWGLSFGNSGLGDSALQRYLDGELWRLKNELRGLLGGCPFFRPRYGLRLDRMRALTFRRVKFAMGLPLLKSAIQEQAENTKHFVSRSLVLGEALSTADVATAVKCGIIYWLFGGAIGNLGSPGQEQKYTGMFAMTEWGHGSNVRGIQTEATFDLSAQEFVIHIPCEDAEKMYIRNATYGNYAVVFAQLIIHGSSQSLHGVDNGILIFDKVRIPRDNLLDKFGSVAPDGQYHSPIKNKNARFSAMLAALTPSRLAVTSQVVGTMQLGLTIAIHYSHRYAGVLLDDDVFQGKELVHSRPLQALVAGLKAYSTWENIRCLQDSYNCIFTNIEVRPSTNKRLQLSEGSDDKRFLSSQLGVIHLLMAQDGLTDSDLPVFTFKAVERQGTNGQVAVLSIISFLAFNMDAVGNLTFLLKAVNFRETDLLHGLLARIHYQVVTKKEDFFSAWKSRLHHVACLPLVHIHRVTLEQFSLAVRHCRDQEDQALLMKFCLLCGTKLVFQERACHLEHKYLTPTVSMRIRSQLLDLCDSVKDDALRVISAFNIPRTDLHAPIAGITNPLSTWAFYPTPPQPPAPEWAHSPRPKPGAKL